MNTDADSEKPQFNPRISPIDTDFEAVKKRKDIHLPGESNGVPQTRIKLLHLRKSGQTADKPIADRCLSLVIRGYNGFHRMDPV